MKRFQVYRYRKNGGLMHITSIVSSSLQEARRIHKLNYPAIYYHISGLDKYTGECIENNFPAHTTRRIENNGVKVPYRGSLYQYIITNK